MVYENTVSSFTIISLLESANALSIIENDNHINLNLLPNDETEDRVSEIDLINLWKVIDESAKNPWYGLEIGSYLDHTNRGLLGSFLTQCETLIDALEHFIINIPWMNPSEKWIIEHNEEFTDLYYSLDLSKGYPLSAVERSMSGIITWGKTLSGTDFKISSASFTFPKPNNNEHYIFFTSCFCENIKFSSDRNHIRIHKKILDRKIPNHNPYLKSLLKEKLNKSIDNFKSNNKNRIYRSEVTKLIIELLPEKKANIDIVCEKLALSRQTLYRHLKKENTNFKEILNNIRKERSIKLLKNTNYKITDISEMLGYTEISSFYTAFNKWHKMGVKKYRDKLISKNTPEC